MQILAGSTDKAIIEKIKYSLNDDELAKAIRFLFSQKFNHLTISSEIHFFGLKPKKKYVMRYNCLSEKIYEDPQLIQLYIESISICLSKIGVQLQSTFSRDEQLL